jgi:hydroxymethylbilane synthase
MTHTAKKPQTLRLGTRGSRLALVQAEWTSARLRALGQPVELVEITTRADRDAAAPLSSFGGTGLFTKEIQRALLAGEVDFVVHSMKDLPTEPVAGLTLAAVPLRESVADAFVATKANSLEELAQGAVIGTGSLRRQAQLRHLRPDLRIVDVRGNVDTRLRKLDAGEFDALVLAEAGLRRLGAANRITQRLSPPTMLPAVGQGALAIECRTDDTATRQMLAQLDDAETRAAVLAERALLARLRGGCLAPVGAWGRMENGRLRLSAVVLSADGQRKLEAEDASVSADAERAEALGRTVAEALLAQGAGEIIAAARKPRRGESP